jgi:hypothetical protein
LKISDELCKEEIDLMMQIYGKIVTREMLDEYLEWEQQQYKKELETQRSFPY